MELNQCENPSSDAQRGKSISRLFGAWKNKVVCVEIWVLHLSMTLATDSKSDLDGLTDRETSRFLLAQIDCTFKKSSG